MSYWDDLLGQGPEKPKKQNWDQLMGEPVVGTPVQEVPDKTRVTVPGSRAEAVFQSYLDKGLNPFEIQDAIRVDRNNRVNSVVKLGTDMAGNNPIKILTMTETDNKLFGISKNKLRRQALDSGAAATQDEVDEAVTTLQKNVQSQMGTDWLQREYNTKNASIDVALDVKDEIGERILQDAYSYAGKFLDETDRKRATINQQLQVERKKTAEEGHDELKVRNLYTQLNSLGKTYTDENGMVIKKEEATPDQQDYINLVNAYYDELDKAVGSGTTDEKKLTKAFLEQYSFVRSLDELYDMDVKPWLEQTIKAQAGPTSYGGSVTHMPEEFKNIVDRRRDATAKLSALTKLALANESPANVKKNINYYLKSAASSFSTSLIGQAATNALKDQFGSTERDMLDAAQSIMYSKGLPVTPEIEKTFERSVLEYANEGAASIMGILPLIAITGGALGAAKAATGLEAVTTAWKTGNAFTKAAAAITDMGLAELQFQVLGSPTGTGAGFGAAMGLMPNIALQNPVANTLLQFMLKPTLITSGMLAGRVTEAGVESLLTYKPYSDILSEKFSDGKEIAGMLIGNFMFGFGHKTVPPENYLGIREYSKRLRAKGDVFEADWVDLQVRGYEKADKAAAKVKTVGMTPKEASTTRELAADQAFAKEVEIRKEEAGFKERIVAPNKVSIVLKRTQVVDSEGRPLEVYHGTDKIFNIFAKEPGMKKSSGSKANSRADILTMFTENKEAAPAFGIRIESRYLNFTNPVDVGNVRSLTKAKIQQLMDQGYDGITGWETINGKKERVYGAFGTRGIVKAESVDPFKSHNAEVLRNWADRLRNTEINTRGMLPASVLPLDMGKAGKKALKIMADILEKTGDVIEALEKGFAHIQEYGWYKKISPELRARYDPEIRKKLQKSLDDTYPEAVAKFDLGRATQMEMQAKEEYLPTFDKEGSELATQFGGKFISDVKKPENVVSKKKRQGLADVIDVPDMVRGAIIMDNFDQFKAISKELKNKGYTIHNKRTPNKYGYRGIYATKKEGDLGVEIQLHTEKTWENQEKAHAIYDKYRNGVVLDSDITKKAPPEPYIEEIPKKGSINLNTTDLPENDKFSEPHGDYEEANGAAVHSKVKNLWVKTGGEDNSGRILMVQFTSRLMGTEAEQTNKAAEYYGAIYKYIPGYRRAQDFWEIPQWQAKLSGSFKNADTYVIRDVDEAAEFIRKSGYKEVAFSVLDVTKEKVKALAEALPDVKFNVGGYIDMPTFFKDNPNVKIFDSIEAMAKDHGVPYVPEYDYRNFKGTKVIPRLQLSTGCKYKCAFCTIPKKVEAVDKNVIDAQVKALSALDASLVYLDDKTFGQADNFGYLTEVYKKMKEANPAFQGFIVQTTSADFANTKKFTPEFIRDSGIKFVELGVETYNDNILAELNKKHASKKYTDAALDNARENGVKIIPNIIVGFPQETAATYENTLNFLKDNRDVISHANIYSLAVYEGTELANSIEAKVEGDMNENVVEKSFHNNPKLHEEYLNKLLAEAKNIAETSGPKMQMEQDLAESNRLFNEAYGTTLEDIKLEGVQPRTAQEKKMRALEIPISTQKELKKAWTETKNKFLGELKGKNLETKEAFNTFIKTLPSLPGLGIKLQARMLKKVNSIDFTKPTSLPKAIAYFDRIVNNATWRYDEAKAEQALDVLIKKGNPESLTKKVPNQPPKNIKSPTGLPLWDELTSIYNDMLNKDWERGQEAIQSMMDVYTKEGRDLGADEFYHITRLNFWGLLNSTSAGNDVREGVSSQMLQGAARDLMDIRKVGSSRAAADKMIKQAQDMETAKLQVGSLTGNGTKSVELDNRLVQNKKDPFLTKMKALFDWPMSSSFFSHLEFLSQYDKTSKPYAGILHESLGDPQWFANKQTFIDRRELFNEINAKAAEIFGTPEGKRLQANAKDRTKTLYTVKYKDVAGVEKELPITMNQAIKVYMELQDPTLEASHESGYYKRNGELTELGQGIIDVLTPEAKAWGDWQINEFYPKLYTILNPIYREFYGRDMPYNSLYSPIFIENADKSRITDDDLLSRQSFVSELKNGSLLSRVKHDKVLRLMDADQVLLSYVHNMTYWKNYSEPIRLLNSFVHNPEIRSAIKQNFINGDDHLKVLQKDVMDLMNRPTDAWMTAGTIKKIRNNILVASLALKIPVGIKQISAAPAFAEFIPMSEIPKYTIKSLVNWFGDKGNLALAKKLWNDAYLQQRYGQGWDNVLTEIMATDYHSVGNRSNWRGKTMFPIVGGDALSVFVGGIPVYRYAYDQAMKKYGPGGEKMAEAEALHVFSRAVDDTQQSGLHFNLSQVQTANDFFKTMTMYKSAPMQYHRKVSAALRNLFSGRGTWQQNAKTIAIYHVVMPALFQWMANGFKWNTKDEIQAGVLGNINNLFVAGDIIEGLINVARGEPWKKYRISPILSTYDDAEAVVTHLPKIHPSDKQRTKGVPPEYIEDVLKAAEGYEWNMLELGKTLKYASKVLGAGLGLPVPGVTAIGQGIYDVATGQTEGKSVGYKVQRILGSSDYTLQNAVEETDLTPEQIDNLLKAKPSNKPVEKEIESKKGDRKVPNF